MDTSKLENSDSMQFSNGNQVSVSDDGWALLAPYGDSIYPLTHGGKTVEVIQRITKENATQMVNAFRSVVGRVTRWMRGSPIYLGHPDDPQTGHRYPVKDQIGMFADIEARDDGLYVRPMFNEKGHSVLEKPEKYYFSGRWPVKETGVVNGKRVYEPVNVTSIGVTRNPNLPTEMLNEDKNHMDKSKIIALLSKCGATLSNDATDEQVLSAVEGIHTAAKTLETTLANEKATLEKAQGELKAFKDAEQAARKVQIESLINERLASGAITEAEKALWQTRLETNFSNEADALKALPAKLKTEQNQDVNGNRNRNPDSVKEAGAKLIQLANERKEAVRKQNPNEQSEAQIFRIAYAHVEAENPTLVDTLKIQK